MTCGYKGGTTAELVTCSNIESSVVWNTIDPFRLACSRVLIGNYKNARILVSGSCCAYGFGYFQAFFDFEAIEAKQNLGRKREL